MHSIKSLLTKKIYLNLLIAELVVFICLAIATILFKLPVEMAAVFGVLGLGLMIWVVSIYYYNIVLPFSAVLKEVKAVLTGRKYRKVYTNRTDELGVFAHFFNEVTSSLEKTTEELEESKKVTGELKTAGQLQKELIPVMAPTIKGFDISVKNRSAEELGGDNLDFITVKDSTYFYVGDVTGHGVPAAIVMTMVNTLINAFAEIYDTAYDIVVQTNRRLKVRIRATMFMSMLMLKWNHTAKKMTYIGCGHEYLIVYRAKTGKCETTVSGGIALGMVPNNSKIVKEKDLPLEVGDVIVLYTDGITEAKNMKGEMYDLSRLTQAVELYAGQNDSEGLLQNIAKDFSNFVEEHVQEDDVTLIAVRRLDDDADGKSSIDQRQERWTNSLEAKVNNNEGVDKAEVVNVVN